MSLLMPPRRKLDRSRTAQLLQVQVQCLIRTPSAQSEYGIGIIQLALTTIRGDWVLRVVDQVQASLACYLRLLSFSKAPL